MSEQDSAEIISVLNLYGFLLDAQQWDLFHLVFTEDLESEFGPAGLAWPDLETLKSHFIEFHEQLDNHQHTMMGHLVRVDADQAYAFSYGNWMLRRDAVEEAEKTWTGSGWYDDKLVRTPNGWRISRRVARLVTWTGNPAVSGTNPEADFSLHVLKDDVEAGKVEFFKALTGA